MNEKDLIKEIQQNPEKFEILFNKHYQLIFNYTFKRTADFDNSRDIVSEVFLKAFLNIRKFKWKGISIVHWLYRIATNEINHYYRSKKYKPWLLNRTYDGVPFKYDTSYLSEEKASAELEMEKHQQFIKVQVKLKKLPLKYQEVITMKYFEQLKIKEIASVLNKKEGTVKSLLSRGLRKLRNEV